MTAPAIGVPSGEAGPPAPRPVKVRNRPAAALLEPAILRRAALRAFVKLDPRLMVKIPVMFVVEIGSVITTIEFLARPGLFVGLVTAWLWATVLFAGFAEAVAEGRGKAQAGTLRRSRKETAARRLLPDGTTEVIPSTQLKVGDRCVVVAGEAIPGDGDVIEGIAIVDESAITGESAPVLRESGGDRSAVTGGTLVLSDRIVVEVTSSPGETFLDRMIALVEGATRQKTPNEIALDILIAGMTLILLVAVVTLQLMAVYDKAGWRRSSSPCSVSPRPSSRRRPCCPRWPTTHPRERELNSSATNGYPMSQPQRLRRDADVLGKATDRDKRGIPTDIKERVVAPVRIEVDPHHVSGHRDAPRLHVATRRGQRSRSAQAGRLLGSQHGRHALVFALTTGPTAAGDQPNLSSSIFVRSATAESCAPTSKMGIFSGPRQTGPASTVPPNRRALPRVGFLLEPSTYSSGECNLHHAAATWVITADRPILRNSGTTSCRLK